jgi:hypothetical protein
MMLWTAPPPARECYECGCLLRSHDSEEPDHAIDPDNRSSGLRSAPQRRHRGTGLTTSGSHWNSGQTPETPVSARGAASSSAGHAPTVDGCWRAGWLCSRSMIYIFRSIPINGESPPRQFGDAQRENPRGRFFIPVEKRFGGVERRTFFPMKSRIENFDSRIPTFRILLLPGYGNRELDG